MIPAGISVAAPRPRRDFEVVGDTRLPVVVALGGISANSHVVAHPGDPTPGWWQQVAAEGAALDPRRCCLVGVEYAQAPGGVVTTQDQARVVAQVLDQLGVTRAHAVIGASYGGMVALAFGEIYPTRAARLVVLCAAHASDPRTTALRVIQRRILRLGLEVGREREAVALARSLGVVTYRGAEEFAARFTGPAAWIGGHPQFPVESYLDHQGARFARRFSADRYLELSESLDLHRCDPGAIRVPTTLVGCRSDTVVPVRQLRELAARLAGPVQLHLLDSPTGHDAFLTEHAAVSRILADTLALEHDDATVR